MCVCVCVCACVCVCVCVTVCVCECECVCEGRSDVVHVTLYIHVYITYVTVFTLEILDSPKSRVHTKNINPSTCTNTHT